MSLYLWCSANNSTWFRWMIVTRLTPGWYARVFNGPIKAHPLHIHSRGLQRCRLKLLSTMIIIKPRIRKCLALLLFLSIQSRLLSWLFICSKWFYLFQKIPTLLSTFIYTCRSRIETCKVQWNLSAQGGFKRRVLHYYNRRELHNKITRAWKLRYKLF